MKNTQAPMPTQGAQNVFTRFFRSLRGKISDVFAPQEVEVIFKTEGNKVRYTYTRVAEKA